MSIACPPTFYSPFLEANTKVEDLLTDLVTVPEDTLVLTVAGDTDWLAGDGGERAIFYALPQIPLENKKFIMIVSDYYGSPSLIAGHLAACSLPSDNEHSPFYANCLDYYGYFKLFDGLTDAAFFGENREYALGNTPEQRYMGKWSDGTPVKELIVTDNP